jgi:hypothetical protein
MTLPLENAGLPALREQGDDAMKLAIRVAKSGGGSRATSMPART